MLQPLDRSQFSTAIACLGCGKTGHVQWEENSLPNSSGPQRILISVSQGFRQGPTQPMSHDPAIVCEDCGTAQPD